MIGGVFAFMLPHLSNTFFITNDIVRLSGKTSFEWLGRFDNVINSGGVKLFPEEIEKKISELIPDKRFYVTGVLDKRLGEKADSYNRGSKLDAREGSFFYERGKIYLISLSDS